MGRSLDEVIEALPAKRKKKVESLAEEKIQDMLASARTLTDIRKAVGKTQSKVAQDLGIQQNAISQLEQRSDTYVSTLRRFLQSLGLELELAVVTKAGTRYALDNFHPWKDADSVAGETAVAAGDISPRKRQSRALMAQKAGAATIRKKVTTVKRAHSSVSGKKKTVTGKRAA